MNRSEFESLLPILGSLQESWNAIDVCIDRNWTIPALTLIYSMIDAMAWLEAPSDKERPGSRFMRWVNKWLLSRGTLHCTDADIYGARCAVLHTMTADSDFSKYGRAKRMAYYTTTSGETQLRKHLVGRDEEFAVVDLLLLAREAKLAVTEFIGSVDHDEMLRERAAIKAAKFYAIFPKFEDQDP